LFLACAYRPLASGAPPTTAPEHRCKLNVDSDAGFAELVFNDLWQTRDARILLGFPGWRSGASS
jgi:hypothetical protein